MKRILFFILVLCWLGGCTPSVPPATQTAPALQEEPAVIPWTDQLTAEQILSLCVSGLTADLAMGSGDPDFTFMPIVCDFLCHMDTAYTPLTQYEYEHASFISGYLSIEFTTVDGQYFILCDVPSELYVIYTAPDADSSLYAQTCIDPLYFNALASCIYEPKNTAPGNIPGAVFYQSSSLSTAINASLGTATVPNWRIRFLPSFCFSSSFFLRVISPP